MKIATSQGSACGVALVAMLSAPAFAAEGVDVVAAQASVEAPSTVTTAGNTESALTGIVRLGLPGLRTGGTWAAAAGTGYGLTEAQGAAAGSHHRLVGSVALGFTPVTGLDVGLRLDGRRDGHPSDAQGADTSYNGEPALTARYGRWSGARAWSGELGVRVPGREAPSLAFDAAVVDLKLGFAFQSGNLTFASAGGFRLDRSAKAAPNLALTRPGDRVALGLSDYNAALLGVGLAYQLNATALLAEISADLLLGGPSLTQSPMRATAGVRHNINNHWQVFALLETSPSARPELGAADKLVPIEPRFGGRFGLAYTFGSAATDAPKDFATNSSKTSEPEAPKPETAAKTEETKTVVQEPAAPETPAGQLRGLIRSWKGQGLRATVRVEPIGIEAQTDEEGAFAVDVPPGAYQVQIVTKGFRTQTREVRIEENGVTVLNADLRRERGNK
ncbi:MAG: carboxypeptidase-like regulatory domain-containing protein [Deltaproteobacteria bacterium]|nr:carboxypeptidase-like regulatory domain-containing protein [Deltaproteobacteria bacterium]